ncbi:hypothetical protein AWS46_03725 [Klebsiella aerogenes]|nr:hypothetical protein APT89_02505 [Enterobacter sp. 50588862]KVI79408.1 hypothetical protein AWS47_18810 [Klebsiella aerogenes]KVI79510.1 hypothetical protein AWS46_03725 [Klebsiella aerogenes]OZU99143.1 hypothetical protein CIW59_04365 [Enterobacter roggenkampii]RNT20833.1 hypothetical protein B9Z99_003430 [Klebsiella aerogenes]
MLNMWVWIVQKDLISRCREYFKAYYRFTMIPLEVVQLIDQDLYLSKKIHLPILPKLVQFHMIMTR